MLGKCFFIICTVSIISSLFFGTLPEMSPAILEGAERGVTLSIEMLGMMCLWSGIMEVLKDAGGISLLRKILGPLLVKIFPDAFESGIGADEITAAVSANMLGIANAATPLALKAMKKLDSQNVTPDTPSDDMVTLTALGSSSVSLFPTSVIALRAAAGSASPTAILLPVWICSFICSAFSVLLCRLSTKNRRTSAKRSSTAKQINEEM